MENKKASEKNINILNLQELVNLTFEVATKCYGIVGISSKEGFLLKKKTTVLDKENAGKGIVAKRISHRGDDFSIDLYVILSADVKISEAIYECQKAVRYMLNKATGNLCKDVNVYAVGIK